MGDVSTFLAMGGYADFVWPSYGLAAVLLVGVLIVTWRGLKARQRLFDELKRDRATS